MFAASPGLHAVEHPIYDVWISDCKGGQAPTVADAPEAKPGARQPQQQQQQQPQQQQTQQRRPPQPPPTAQRAPPPPPPPTAQRTPPPQQQQPPSLFPFPFLR